MFKKILLLFLTLVSLQVVSDESSADYTQQVTKIITNEGLVGLSWSTVTDEGSISGSAGYANLAKSELMKPGQKMHVGSVSKSVLALGVLRLISEGRLSLDTNVETLLPQLNFKNPWGGRSPITVRSLLEHTAGLENVRMWQFLSTQPTPHTPLENAFASNFSTLLKVRTEPGTQYAYSNMGYALLGMVIEAVTQQDYEAYLDNNLLAPLGMRDSSFAFISQQADPLLAMGYHEHNVPQAAVPTYLRPAGQFTTTAPDMTKFMTFALGDGQLNGETFISSPLMTMLAHPQGTDAHAAGLNIGHGLAFATRDRHGVVGHCHPGETFGFHSFMCLFPEEGKGFFYASNTDSELADYEKLTALFIHGLALPSAPIVGAAEKTFDTTAFEGIYLLSPNSMAEFELIDRLFGFIWLRPANDHLVMKSLQSEDKRLVQVSDKLFRDTERTQPSHVFYTNKEGELLLSDGLKTYKKGSLTDLVFYWLSIALGLIGIVYILLLALYRLGARNFSGLKRLIWPCLNLVAVGIPAYFYAHQSFLEFGDPTRASLSLTLVTALLPITLLLSLRLCFKSRDKTKSLIRDAVFILMALQLCVVLGVWGLLPTIFWHW
ncbi:serine hydrolase domain-containing protein [Pseudoalteromonas sp. BDTF-M6]|uniref:serine hydrolase domain-containing protein n=1 Tax=Pseudoalteromonas sp. BDTF-M6 TaxID=2796132 RepID=UPI001BAF8F09|nr:serine hydrolase domain-containing protein [Pseudoalteromonas sp. BDTF-M6]MBS3798000.1 beta-lactamase family protein [Pseudoalteromonas sp. BDTF-M6]